MKKIRMGIQITAAAIALTMMSSAMTVFAALPGDSILIGGQGYSSDYVAEHTNEINLKIDTTKDNIYYIDENNKIYNMFDPAVTVTEKQIAEKYNRQITYYTKDKIQSYVAKDINSPFELKDEYAISDTSVEVVITASGVGSYKTLSVKMRNLTGIPEGKYFKLESKNDIKSINDKDSISLLTSKATEKIFILSSDRKTYLAEGILYAASAQSGSVIIDLSIRRSDVLNPSNVTVTNKSGKTDIVEVTGLQSGTIIKVYDGIDSTLLLGKATATSNGIASIKNLNLLSGGGIVKVTQTKPTYVEGYEITKNYGEEQVPALGSKPTFSDPTGFENNDKTQIKLGSPSVKTNTFRYKISPYSIDVPTISQYAHDWIPVVSGDLIPDALNKYIGVVEVNEDGLIIRFTEGTAVVVNETIAKLKNGLKFIDVAGIDNNDKTEIALGDPSEYTNRFVYKISSSNQAVPAPKYGDLLTAAAGWNSVSDGDWISVTAGKHIGVAEVDSSGKAVQFSNAAAVVTNEGLPALQYGLKFVDVPGEANNGKTQIVLGSPSAVGNTFKYKISQSSSAVPKPNYKENIGAASLGWQTIWPGDYITVANGKHIGVAEVNSNNEVIQFSDTVAVVVNENSASNISDIKLEYTLDDEGNKKVKFILPEVSFPSNKYRYTVSSNDKAVETPNTGASVSSWTAVENGDLKSIEYGKNIGVAEVDSGMKVLKFSNIIPVNDSSKLAPALASLSLTDALGSENNGRTKVDLPAPNAGNSFKYMISANDNPVPPLLTGEDVSSWNNVYDNDTIATVNGKYIGIAEVTPAGKVVKFSNAVAVVVNDNRELVGGVSFIAGTSYQTNGKTQIVLGQPSVPGNKFKYTISYNSSAVTPPAVGAVVSSWTSVKDGDFITTTDGKHIGVAEVDSSDKVVAFSDAVAKVVNYVSPLVNSLSLTDIAGINNNGKVYIKNGTPSNVSNSFAYKIFDALPAENYKITDTATGFTAIPSDKIITLEKGKYVGVAEINSSNVIVQFSIVQNNIENEKIETSVTDGQIKMLSGNYSADSSDFFSIKVTKGTLKAGTLTRNADYTVTGLPSGMTITAVANSDNTITVKLSGTLSSALTEDTELKLTLMYTCITESGVDSTVNSTPVTLTIKKY